MKKIDDKEMAPRRAVVQRGIKPGTQMTIEQAMELTGTTTPREALKAMSAQTEKRLVYMPHVGAKQRAKALKRMQQAEERALPTADEVDAAEIMAQLRQLGLSECQCIKSPPCHWCVEGWEATARKEGLIR